MDRIHILATGTSRGIGAAIAAIPLGRLADRAEVAQTVRRPALAPASAIASVIDGNGARHVR